MPKSKKITPKSSKPKELDVGGGGGGGGTFTPRTPRQPKQPKSARLLYPNTPKPSTTPRQRTRKIEVRQMPTTPRRSADSYPQTSKKNRRKIEVRQMPTTPRRSADSYPQTPKKNRRVPSIARKNTPGY